jgi:hypothetical protein
MARGAADGVPIIKRYYEAIDDWRPPGFVELLPTHQLRSEAVLR